MRILRESHYTFTIECRFKDSGIEFHATLMETLDIFNI